MSVTTDAIVRRTIRHAVRMTGNPAYEWPTARAALIKILLDLEGRSPADPSLERLRDYIAQHDQAFALQNSVS